MLLCHVGLGLPLFMSALFMKIHVSLCTPTTINIASCSPHLAHSFTTHSLSSSVWFVHLLRQLYHPQVRRVPWLFCLLVLALVCNNFDQHWLGCFGQIFFFNFSMVSLSRLHYLAQKVQTKVIEVVWLALTAVDWFHSLPFDCRNLGLFWLLFNQQLRPNRRTVNRAPKGQIWPLTADWSGQVDCCWLYKTAHLHHTDQLDIGLDILQKSSHIDFDFHHCTLLGILSVEHLIFDNKKD